MCTEIRSRTNFCMMLSHPSKCLNDILRNIKNHVGICGGGGGGVGEVYKKSITFYLADFGIEQ